MSWANTYRKTNNRKVVEFLIQVLQDKNKDMIRRIQAYFNVSLIEPKDWSKILDCDTFDAEIDWDLLNSILQEAI